MGCIANICCALLVLNLCQGATRRLGSLSCHLFRDDLLEGPERPGIALCAHAVANVDSFLGFADLSLRGWVSCPWRSVARLQN